MSHHFGGLLDKALKAEEGLFQYHFPGYNYLGPGTRFITNLVNDVKPINAIDKIAMYHDLEYVLGNYDKSDINAMRESLKYPLFESKLLQYGLGLRYVLGVKFNNIYGADANKLYSWAKFKIAKW